MSCMDKKIFLQIEVNVILPSNYNATPEHVVPLENSSLALAFLPPKNHCCALLFLKIAATEKTDFISYYWKAFSSKNFLVNMKIYDSSSSHAQIKVINDIFFFSCQFLLFPGVCRGSPSFFFPLLLGLTVVTATLRTLLYISYWSHTSYS